ncbi:twin-arginine translocase subunit TatC [Paenibacillus nasutitermitis]|uniref:Sec-independent protein translocase protein TatC n=1 Tax=Paenibacillus nasutitermitis TaxID=1652958 RepID=A0A916YNP0_9BACL|nr:twin-arginine translocase subunit TatC [Paenibacillus nasutitermitis]GGD54104.1 Sec-independent protein translocase protein TatCy [Paenibacillus nasutitermitis]
MKNNDEDLIRHLSELRKRLILVAAWFAASFCGGLYLSPMILRYIKSRPGTVHIQWNVFSFTDGLFIYLRCALLFAVLLTLPLLLYHIWAFARPGLTAKEAKGTLSYVPVSFLLFLSGISFSYFLVFPMMLRFMEQMNQSIGAVETYGIDRYFSFLFNLVLPLGIAFEMPLVILFLTRLGLLTPDKLRSTRKYAYVTLAVAGSCISPPDFASHLSVTIPLLVLFEISVLISVNYYRRRGISAVPSSQT